MTERESRDKLDAALDETLDESFPASDPPANTVETGVAGSPQGNAVYDNKEKSCFELKKNGQIAFLTYMRSPDSIDFIHTEVPPSLRGQHLADALASAGLAAARAEGLRVVATCRFIQSYLREHPEAIR